MNEPGARRSVPTFLPIFGALTVVVLVGIVAIAVIVASTGSDASASHSSTLVVEVGQWHVDTEPTVPAGDVTFKVLNGGTMVHEMLVLQTDTPADELPLTDAGDPPVPVATGANKVSEDDNIGETGDPDFEPGTTRIFTVDDMTPGHYVLICNLEGHYANGMRTDLTVTG